MFNSHRPVLMYGNGTWAVVKAEQNLLEGTDENVEMDDGNKED